MAHPVEPVAKELRELLLRELARTGELSWDGEVGRKLALRATEVDAASGWVDSSRVATLFETNLATAPDESDETDPVDLLMAAHRRSKEAERRQAALQWLLEA
jgi:hypothetical protein